MIKRNVKLMTTLTLAISLGMGALTVSAATISSNGTQKIEQKICKHNEHADSMYSILKNLGYTGEQIDSARTSGKTAFDLAKEKGKTAVQLKAMIIDAQTKRIDEAVTNGRITKEKAVNIKANLKIQIENWNGSLNHKGHNKGHNKGQFRVINLVLKNNLGFTDAQIKDASNSGKTAFDLAKEKGKTPAQLKVMIIEAQSKRIDEAVTKGKITKEKAVTIKSYLKTKLQNWDGNLQHKNERNKAR